MPNLYKVECNWFGEVHTIWTHAKLPSSAFNQATVKLAKKVGYDKGFVRCHLRKGNGVTIRREEKKCQK